ncbi:hypothetical protein [Lacisediminimonas sp.]|uniref:hypothetical protein n=1 Tax=Lacisediminimonas sp. TaxID=3060582 RepID=UPI00272CC118|nr:hypothetical protein [Lacisediminimonas sp.]
MEKNKDEYQQALKALLSKPPTLQAVTQLAKHLANAESLELDTAVKFCNMLKLAESDIESAAYGGGQHSLLAALRTSLPLLLPKLAAAIERSPCSTEQIDSIAYGLGALAGESRGAFHDGRCLTADALPFQQACRALLGKCVKGQITFSPSNGSTLALLNLLSRGLKRGLLDRRDGAIRAAFTEALLAIKPGTTSATEHPLDARQNGKWLLQLSSISTYELLDLDADRDGAEDGQDLLAAAAREFLGNTQAMSAQAQHTHTVPNSVIVQNHIDATRNLGKHGVLNIRQDPDLQLLLPLLQLIGALDPDALHHNYGRTLGSITRFLLFLKQQGVSTHPVITSDFSKIEEKVLTALSCFAQEDLTQVGSETIADLLEFLAADRKQAIPDLRLSSAATPLLTALTDDKREKIEQAAVAAKLLSAMRALRNNESIDHTTCQVEIALAEVIYTASHGSTDNILCAVAALESLAACALNETERQNVLRSIEQLLLQLPPTSALNNADKLLCLRGLALLLPLSSGVGLKNLVALSGRILGKKAPGRSQDDLIHKEILHLQQLTGQHALVVNKPQPENKSLAPAPVTARREAAGASTPAPALVTRNTNQRPAAQGQTQPVLVVREQSRENKKPAPAGRAKAASVTPKRAARPAPAPAAKLGAGTPAQQQAEWFDLLQNGQSRDLTIRLDKLLRTQPALLNATQGKHGRQTAMVLAVANGHKDVLAWLWQKPSLLITPGPDLIDAILDSMSMVDRSVADALDAFLHEIEVRFQPDGLAKLKGFSEKLLPNLPLIPDVMKKYGLIKDLPAVATVAKASKIMKAPTAPIAPPLTRTIPASVQSAVATLLGGPLGIDMLEISLLKAALRGKAAGWNIDETRAAVLDPDPSRLWQMLVGEDAHLRADMLDRAAAAAIMAIKRNPARLREILALQHGRELLDHTLVSGETIRHFMEDMSRNQARPEIARIILDADAAAAEKQASALQGNNAQ